MDNPGEILRLCRLCLVKDQVNIPIFEEQGDIRQTFLKIRSCLPVKVSRDDKLPKKICGGCSNKLDLFYEFWSSTANSEKTLQSWLGQEEEDDKMQEITKPVEALVKEESEALEDGHAHDQSFDEATKDEAEAPPAKRARRTAAVKAQINISHDSDEDEDVDGAEPITKIEDESDDSDGEEKDPSYTEVPGTSADDQAGPSGLGKDGVEAPCVPRTSPQVYLLKSPAGIQVVFGAIPPKVINVAQQIRVIPAKIAPKRVQTIAPKGNIVPKVRPQPCPECGKLVLFLTEHMRRKHNKVPLSSMGTSLTPGNKTRKDRKPKICPDCGKAFIHLKLHIKLAHSKILSAPPEKPLRACPICDKKCKFLAKHIRVKHNASAKQPRTTLCPTCGKLISDNTRHYHKAEFACDLCFISCKSQELLEEHKRVHEGDHHKCEHCPWIFLSLVDLAVHHYKHTKIYKCPKCPKTFKTYSALVHHVSLEENTFKFRCEVCGKGFTAKHLLVSHLERHENVKKYQCRFCDKKFSVKTYVKSHERLNHRKEVYGVDESFQCEYCSKMFNFECSLKRHLKLVHKVGGEKKVQCTVCSKEFTTRYSLTVHTRLHTGERNYNCTMCEERFHRAQCLTRHMARRHGVVKKRVEST
ncbi:zinc finger protein 883-like isoform X12 [Euwallacea similis]|uniref:zinc finger protein 883-like isoform X12 n=1 Tax=Euwallacea similis TaxID=1736056 RepID=UPI00344ECFA4